MENYFKVLMFSADHKFPNSSRNNPVRLQGSDVGYEKAAVCFQVKYVYVCHMEAILFF